MNCSKNNISWWADFARFSHNPDENKAFKMNTDAVTALSGLHDEGIGALSRETFFKKISEERLKNAKKLGLKVMAWLELMGESRTQIGAVNEIENGVFEQDELTGMTKIIASYYEWNKSGYGINPAANRIIWVGAHSWANRETYYGNMAMPREIPEPTYPNGDSALGVLEPGSIDPRKYKFYDALACKSIFGTFVEQEQFSTPDYKNMEGFLIDPLIDGGTRKIGDYYFSRDIACDWWIEYNRNAVRSFLEKGADGFWTDNYTGWGFIGVYPVLRAFGEWSLAGFRDYLKQHPIQGIAADTFDIRDYLIDKAKQEHPDLDTTTVTTQTVLSFNSPAWLDDPVWNSFLSYKSQVVSKHTTAFYQMVKEEAKKLGLNPDDIVVAGNDIAILQNAAVGIENVVDILSVEYVPEHSPVTQNFSDQVPMTGYGGPHYKLITQLSRSKRGSIWYYIGDKQKSHNNILGMFLHFEALSNNVTLNSEDRLPDHAGTEEAAVCANHAIAVLRKDFGRREIRASVGLYNSGSSEFCQLTPGGYINGGAIPSTMAYYGWGRCLERNRIPYQTITESRISKNELEGIEVLLMASVTAISEEIVENVIRPFLDQGKVVVITGKKAGEKGMREQQFAKHDRPLLVALAENYSGPGKVVYLEQDPTIEAYVNKEDKTLFERACSQVEALFSDLNKHGLFHKSAIASSLGPDFLISTHHDRENQALFVDLVNRNLDIEGNKVYATRLGEVSLRLPEWKDRNNMVAKIHTIDENGNLNTVKKSITATVDTVTVEVPSFAYYASIVIH